MVRFLIPSVYLHGGYFLWLLLSTADLFQNYFFIEFFHRNTIRMSNGLDPDQDPQNVGADLSPNCLQRLSADDKKSPLVWKELKRRPFSGLMAAKGTQSISIKPIDYQQFLGFTLLIG